MTHSWRTAPLVPLLVLALGLVACGSTDGGSTSASPVDEGNATSVPDGPPIEVGDPVDYDPQIDPDDFMAGIDNSWLPFTPGSRWVYQSDTEDGLERIEVVVTDETRTVMGVEVTVVRDSVTLDGRLIEDTRDWYAQDRAGTVWYFGEETTEYDEDGSVSTDGSWEAGVDGALPGIIMLADPQVGQAYRQEFYEGEAEDVAEVVRTDDTADVAAGRFEDLVAILEWNPFEPGVLEEKLYARGVGPVLEQKVRGGDQRVELVEHAPEG
jgi:hypothetical protein